MPGHPTWRSAKKQEYENGKTMTATTNYQAGVESNQAILSYAQEAVWGTLPAVPFQQIRYTGESLSGTKQRNRPAEILSTGEVAAAITTQESAGGGVNFALSYGTFDDLIAGALNSDWSAAVVANSVAGDITVSAGAAGSVRTLTSSLAGKFTGIVAGQFIVVRGFTQPSANGYFQVTSANGTVLTFLNALSTTAETPAGSAVAIRACTLVNGTTFKSFHVQQKFSPSLYLRYPGSFVSGMTVSGGAGQFLNGSFTFLSQSEAQFAVDASTGSVLPPPTGKVHDPVSNFAGVFLDGQPIAAVVDSFSLTTSDTGAAQEFGMGSAAAQGIVMGLLEVKGMVKVYFKDFSLYARFKSETTGNVSFVTKDAAGNAYAITVLAASLQNPKIEASGPNQPVMASFDLEGNPRAGGGTLAIDRLSST